MSSRVLIVGCIVLYCVQCRDVCVVLYVCAICLCGVVFSVWYCVCTVCVRDVFAAHTLHCIVLYNSVLHVCFVVLFCITLSLRVRLVLY